MEALSKSLAPYKDLVGALATYLTIAQFFSGVFLCLDIKKRGQTTGISSVPFIGGIVMGLAMLKYGLMLNDDVMLVVNVAAIILNVCYTIFYHYFSIEKWEEVYKPLSIGMAVVATLYGYCEWEDPSKVEFRYGLISTILMLMLMAAPLIGVKEIIKNKDASAIPFVLTSSATIVTFFWLLYGIILLNDFMIVQNLLGFSLCFVQLILIFVYPGKPTKIIKKKTN